MANYTQNPENSLQNMDTTLNHLTLGFLVERKMVNLGKKSIS